MFYTYNRKNLELKRFGFKHYSILVLVLFLTYTVGRFIQVNHLTLYEKEFIIYMDRNYFSQDALIESLKAKHLNRRILHLEQDSWLVQVQLQDLAFCNESRFL